ncbi:hypothetical protein PVAND_010831 [Polypedilum vanderplanki]|uniref:RanBD1 domain-containing protein n=1 Tax=Polypedilum vanderplanki TaxID=319348 RepID=A0A9J6CHG6_POLVA|nr:hypothetical protein PVAND_010831 [Polypedilum vanderplanki]
MAAKRIAGRELNHDNWNEEEEAEDAGEFKKASEDILAKRVRKVAKRRTADNESGTQVLNPFSGFGGFGSNSNTVASTPISSSSPFSFLAKLPASASSASTAPIISSTTTKTNGEAKENGDSKYSEYNGKVKALNIAFTDWIKKHVDDNALCDLRPVFADYEKYMKEFNELKQKISSSSTSSEKKEESFKSDTPAGGFTFGKPATTTATSPVASIFSSVNTSSIFSSSTTKETSPAKPTESKGFSFGLASNSQQPTSAPTFSFGLKPTSSLPGSSLFGISTTTSTPFSFANVTQTKSTADNNIDQGENTEADEEPPKNEFVPVVEEDSLLSKRCKVFVKTGTDYTDRGVGTLYLKKVDEKVQLIVRADTNLGNILLNIILQEGLPTSRLGKNNVMIVCVPTPESKPPPTPVLVRVKTGEEADELLSILEKYKKGAE